MQVRVKDESVEIEGYVNAVERKSKPLMSRIGQFIERICKGAFTRALDRNDDVRLLYNHDWTRDLGGTKDGNLELVEDNIGLHARAVIKDKEVVEDARNGNLVGWSFGFTDREVDMHDEGGMPTRDVKDMNLYEVSLLNRKKTPAYDGTLVSVRADDDIQYQSEPLITEIQYREEKQLEQSKSSDKQIDYGEYERLIEDMKEEK